MSRPIELRVSTDLDVSAAIAWCVVSDYRLDPCWRRGVETMDPVPHGPVESATTTREILRLGGRTYRSEGVIEAFEPGRTFAWRTVSGATASGSRTVDSLGDERCRVTLELCVVPRPAERLLVPILRRMLVTTLRTDLVRLAERIDDLATAHTGDFPARR